MFPVQIIEAQISHFARAQSEPCKEQHDRMIASTNCSYVIASGEHSIHAVRRKMLGQRRQRPEGDTGYRRSEIMRLFDHDHAHNAG